MSIESEQLRGEVKHKREKEKHLTGHTHQKQAPTSGHESKDANNDVLECHAW